MLDLPEDTLARHSSPGRLRLKVPSQKRNQAFFDRLQARLNEVPGLIQVQVNPLSGSILILYTELPEELSSLARPLNGVAAKRNSGSKPNTLYQKISGGFEEVNGRIRSFTKGELDIPSLSFIALLTVGIYQISRRNFAAPAWYTAFWYALNIFLKAKE
jgi:hypothetical protein